MDPVNDIGEVDDYTPKSMREVLASMNVRLTPEASKQNESLFRFISCLDKDTFSVMCNLMKTYGVLLPKQKQKQKAGGRDNAKKAKPDRPDFNGTGEPLELVTHSSCVNKHRRTIPFLMYTTFDGYPLPS